MKIYLTFCRVKIDKTFECIGLYIKQLKVKYIGIFSSHILYRCPDYTITILTTRNSINTKINVMTITIQGTSLLQDHHYRQAGS